MHSKHNHKHKQVAMACVTAKPVHSVIFARWHPYVPNTSIKYMVSWAFASLPQNELLIGSAIFAGLTLSILRLICINVRLFG